MANKTKRAEKNLKRRKGEFKKTPKPKTEYQLARDAAKNRHRIAEI